jgi:hypothetical protein
MVPVVLVAVPSHSAFAVEQMNSPRSNWSRSAEKGNQGQARQDPDANSRKSWRSRPPRPEGQGGPGALSGPGGPGGAAGPGSPGTGGDQGPSRTSPASQRPAS